MTNHIGMSVSVEPSEAIKFTTITNTKNPTLRNHFGKGCYRWLMGRRTDDNAEGLWRVHHMLYDLSDFVYRHPGGSEWLILAKGTDVTEAYETLHLNTKPAQILKKYYVRDATGPRNYRLTFNESDFYKTLRRKAVEKLNTIDIEKEAWKSRLIFDMNLFVLIASVCLSAVANDGIFHYLGVFVAGMCTCFSTFIGHNFAHMKNNWRMYGCHAVLINFREFRVSHAMSHHMYANSAYDLEISIYEPFIKYMPVNESYKRVLINYTFIPVAYFMGFHFTFAYRVIGALTTNEKIFYLDDLIGLSLPLLMLTIGKAGIISAENIWQVFVTWNMIIIVGSFFVQLIAASTGHQGTRIVHEGDEFKSLDFGIYQLAVTVDRYESDANIFAILAAFGEHVLHHLFPTLDHSILHHFHDELMETCEVFKEDLRKISVVDAVIENFKQQARGELIILKKME